MYSIVSYALNTVTALKLAASSTILNWHDSVEIIFFVITTYAILSWLSQDTQKPLVLYAYGYSALIFGSYYYELSSMYHALIYTSPIVGLLFIVIHQDILQKNFIALKTIQAKEPTTHNWMEELVRSMIHIAKKHKQVICYLERNDSIAHNVQTEHWLNANINSELIELLYTNTTTEQTPALWVTCSGKIITHKPIVCFDHGNAQTSSSEQWIHDGQLLTHKTDTLVIACTKRTEPTVSHHFSIIAYGTITHNMTSNEILYVLQKLGEQPYAPQPQKHSACKQYP